MMGYVYIISAENTAALKIGISDKSINQRLSSLQSGNPYKLTVKRLISLHDFEIFEKRLHARFSNDRVRGEWFNISLSLVDEAISQLIMFFPDAELVSPDDLITTDSSEIENNIDFLADTDLEAKVSEALKLQENRLRKSKDREAMLKRLAAAGVPANDIVSIVGGDRSTTLALIRKYRAGDKDES